VKRELKLLSKHLDIHLDILQNIFYKWLSFSSIPISQMYIKYPKLHNIIIFLNVRPLNVQYFMDLKKTHISYDNSSLF